MFLKNKKQEVESNPRNYIGRMFYAKNQMAEIGSWIYIYKTEVFNGIQTPMAITINGDHGVLYINDPWPEHIINQRHIKEYYDYREFIRVIFEFHIDQIKDELNKSLIP